MYVISNTDTDTPAAWEQLYGLSWTIIGEE
jgi:hypothetical protein